MSRKMRQVVGSCIGIFAACAVWFQPGVTMSGSAWRTAALVQAEETADFLPERAGGALQQRIDQAEAGETILLSPGVYDGPVVIRKQLVLQAEEGAVLRNTTEAAALVIEAADTIVTGLALDDETIKEQPTVLVRADRVRLDRLSIRTGSHAIMMQDADEGEVTRSTIAWGSQEQRLADKGNGIDLFEAHRVRIAGNTISSMHDAIYLENSDDTVVTNNMVSLSRYGIHCMYTKRTQVYDNVGDRNVTGAMVMASRGVGLYANTFAKQSENVNSQGILLYDAHEGTVVDNVADGNRVGLYVEESTGNTMTGNIVRANFIGIQLLESANNMVTANSFIRNVVSAQAQGSDETNLNGNYWDSFQGIDTDGDGISNTRYAIHTFFQSLTKKRPAFQLFFQSPGMAVLEQMMQEGRHDWVTDHAPLMAPAHDMLRQEGDTRSRMWTGTAGAGMLAAAGVLIWTMRRRTR